VNRYKGFEQELMEIKGREMLKAFKDSGPSSSLETSCEVVVQESTTDILAEL
jgi:hypothetical protein